jgi:hypothetical protein
MFELLEPSELLLEVAANAAERGVSHESRRPAAPKRWHESCTSDGTSGGTRSAGPAEPAAQEAGASTAFFFFRLA